ncbi:unnamed protein product [Urochloa humidicola]
MMPASASANLDSGCPRRSPRLKKIHIISDEHSDRDVSTFKRVKTEVIDSEEITSPSTSELSVASVVYKDGEQDCHDVSLKDLRAQCKAKNRKISKIMVEGCGIRNQTKTKEDFDLDKPLISLKQKRPKTSPVKKNRKMEALTSSPCPAEVDDTTSKKDNTLSPTQSSPFKATMCDPALRRAKDLEDLEQSQIAMDCTEEIVGEQICCAEVKNTAGALAICGKLDVLCEIKIEDMDFSEGLGTSSCSIKNSEHSSLEMQQELMDGDECIPQSCFMDQPTQLANVSDHSCEETCSSKEKHFDDITAENATEIVSSVRIIGEVRDGDGPESIKITEELSPIDKSITDVVSPLKIVQSDLCGSTEMNCTSLEEVVQMQGECQLDSIVCCGVRPKHMSLDMGIGHTCTDYTFSFDKTLDLVQPVNFVAQDGRLESIVYDVLNNQAQRMTSENRSSVELSDTAVIQSSVIDFNDNCPEDKNLSDYKVSFPDNVEWPLKDKLNSTRDYDICRPVNNEGPEEELVLPHQLFQSCADKLNPSSFTPEMCNAETSQKLSAGAPDSSSTSLETDGRTEMQDPFIDEESNEEHVPKKLLSKRKIMSPTSQEKLCNALTGIDLCDGVQRLKRKIIIEDCDKTRISLPQPAHKQDRSMISTDRRLKGRASVSPINKGVLKSTGSPPHQQTTCSCMRSSPVVLDTEKAVEFSQRQMQDIENIAAKLIRSLKHMKSIVDESLSSDAYSLLPHFNIAEIRAASEDALEVEKTTRKWLSIMNKDCNRFCKILSLAKKNVVSHPEVPRKQRKITFADETGGMLCHVKVFKDGQNSLLSECRSDL